MNRPIESRIGVGAFALFVWLLLSAPAGATAGHGDGRGINWFEGSVEEAFATAKRQNKPLFVYWGARWCPPCNYLKTRVFPRPEVVSASRKFIALYLDGDTEAAQRWGERFDARGYPTVIVFRPDGTELLRMSSDMPIDEYASLLDHSLARLQTIHDLVGMIEAGRESDLTRDDWTVLAFHAWDQDRSFDRPPAAMGELFRILWKMAPGDMAVERSRLLAQWLRAAAAASAAAGNVVGVDESRRREVDAALRALLSDPKLRTANVFFIQGAARDTVELLWPERGPERSRLIEAWRGAVRALEEDDALDLVDRLDVGFAAIELDRAEKGEDAPPSKELVDHLVHRARWALERVKGKARLQAALSSVVGLLTEVGQHELARSLLLERLDQTKAPYYYMSYLARIERELGQTEQALTWYRRAWEASEGPSTRFQWGSSYVRALVELAPRDVEAIGSALDRVFGELLKRSDAFANRNYSRLRRLEKTLLAWRAPGAEAVVEALRERVRKACTALPVGPENEALRDRCTSYLAGRTGDAAS